MRKFKYVGPFDEVEVPALGVTVQRGHQVEVDDVDVADSFDAQEDWQHVPDRKRSAAAKKAAAKSTPAKKTTSSSAAGADSDKES